MHRRDFLTLTGALTSALTGTAALAGSPLASLAGSVVARRARPRPTAAQLRWQQDELALFLHFGVNTFTNREWGDGTESPSIFAPTALDARQWARSARAAGFRAMVLTAKHHDGFCLWPTRTTTHSVASSPFRGGAGDVVREFTNACKAEGLAAGLYLSPWDRNSPVYGDTARYNDLYADQLTELLTNYGPINEVWFDGANGEGPNGKRQQYDWPRVWGLVRRHQPNAVIFSDAGPDVRWCGNERGVAGDTNWSTVDPTRVTHPGSTDPGVTEALQQGDRDGTVWRPAEADTSIRPGWFYHAAEDRRVRTAENLEELYLQSVGRNAKLLLNVPPTPAGLLHATDVAMLEGARVRLANLFGDPVTNAVQRWRQQGSTTGTLTVSMSLPASPAIVRVVRIAEPIADGQRIARWSLHGQRNGAWIPLARGTTVGYARIERIRPEVLTAVRLDIEDAVEPPLQPSLTLYR